MQASRQSPQKRAPTRFHPVGDLEWARLCRRPDWLPVKEYRTGSQAAGVRYERRVHSYLQTKYGPFYLESPWFVYKEVKGGQTRFCQPDGLLFDFELGILYVIEAKLAHTADSWWQLFWKYIPVVRMALCEPDDLWQIATVEVTKWYDPAVRCPQQPRLYREIHLATPGEYGVHIYRP